ncbi:MAG: YutD family protein [Bacilli bacterium]|nr:YutD family protein [Bacilli bacterium]
MIEINNRQFELIKDERNAFDLEEFERLFTDYFYDYDYIVGDIAYSKLRLKGFYDSKNKKAKSVNNIDNLQDYIDNYCAYGCRYFVLKCIK